MKKIRVDDVENRTSAAAVFRPLSDALGTIDVAVNYFELARGDSFGFAYHAHEIQEEVFAVLAGTATFETEEGPVDVAAGELVRFAPGEFQRGTNRGDERVVALALGAPREHGEIEKLRDCPTCGERTPQDVDGVGEKFVATCRRCGVETARWEPPAR